jgi:hypothetical protein
MPHRVVTVLFLEPEIPVGIHQAFENIMDQPLLVFRIETAADRRSRHLPMIAHKSAQVAQVRMHKVPVETDFFSLPGGEAGEKVCHGRFGRARGLRVGQESSDGAGGFAGACVDLDLVPARP